MARIELISCVERRRRWSDEAKLRILAEVARRHDIYPAQIRLWRKTFATFDLPGTLVPVSIVDDVVVGGGVDRREPGDALRIASAIEITLHNGRDLNVSADIDPGMLKSLATGASSFSDGSARK